MKNFRIRKTWYKKLIRKSEWIPSQRLLSYAYHYCQLCSVTGQKKYSFENGQIKTATEYAGERQDAMQELNKQRTEAESYIRDICKAILWFSNTFQGTNWNVDEEITVSFDDSYVTDRQSEMESKRADALSFREIPKLTIWYLMDRYNLSEDEAVKLYNEGNLEDTDDETED